MSYKAYFVIASALAFQAGFASQGLAEGLNQNSVQFESFPNELQAMVFNYLPCQDLAKARSVCSGWNQLILSSASHRHFLQTPNEVFPRTRKAKFSPDGEWVLLEGVTKDFNSVVSIYSGRTGQHLRDFYGLYPVFSLDGRSILMTEIDPTLSLGNGVPVAVSSFDLDSGERKVHFSLNSLPESQRKHFEYGRFFFADGKNGVFFYNSSVFYYLNFEESKLTELYTQKSLNYIRSIKLSPDHKHMIVSKASIRDSNWDGTNLIFDTSTLKVRLSTVGKSRFLLNGKYIGSSQFHHLDIHDIESGSRVSRLPFGGFLSGKSDSNLFGVWLGAEHTKIWNLKEKKSVMKLPAMSSEIFISPNEKKIVVYHKKLKRLTCHSTATGNQIHSLSVTLEGSDKKNQIAFSSDGQLLAVNTKMGQVLVWNLETGDVTELDYPVKYPAENEAQVVNSLSFSPDRRSLLVTYQDLSVTLLWRLR